MTSRATVDRAALVRRARVELVAERGIHGTSMNEVAERAGVATGTAYVYYESKEDVLIASFVEVKGLLGGVAMEGIDLAAPPRDVFEAVWRRVHGHLMDDPPTARFLTQLEASPLRGPAHESLPGNDPLTRVAEALAPDFVDLPSEILYDLALAPAVRLVAAEVSLDSTHLELLIEACWRAVSSDS